jgi:hypothetical protein
MLWPFSCIGVSPFQQPSWLTAYELWVLFQLLALRRSSW